MAMVSIKRHMAQSEQETALRQVITLLLDGIATRVAQGDRNEYETFQNNMLRIKSEAEADAAPDALLVGAGSAVQALGDYAQHTTRFIRKQGAELQNIISMLTRTVISIGAGGDRSVQRLQEIGKKLESAVELEDVQILKARLGDCLDTVREECAQQKTEADELISSLHREIEVTKERATDLTQSQDLDPVTGLLVQEAAEAALQVLVKKGGRRYLVTAVINRMQPINARFGHAVGNQVLRTFKEFFEKQITPGDRLFRWNGPALVALLERTESLETVRSEVRKMLDVTINDVMFDVGGRQVLIPISAAWSVFMLIPPITTATKQIQTFIASQGGRDYA
jgi:GGDEF domain-containing protein